MALFSSAGGGGGLIASKPLTSDLGRVGTGGRAGGCDPPPSAGGEPLGFGPQLAFGAPDPVLPPSAGGAGAF
eukprot:3422891-Alexandrium_andersonii.AAC.1